MRIQNLGNNANFHLVSRFHVIDSSNDAMRYEMLVFTGVRRVDESIPLLGSNSSTNHAYNSLASDVPGPKPNERHLRWLARIAWGGPSLKTIFSVDASPDAFFSLFFTASFVLVDKRHEKKAP